MHVLLIEDDASISESIALILKVEGIAITISCSGSDGINHARNRAFDLIVLDLGLPDMTGLEVLAALRESMVATPLMVLSGLHEIQQKVRALAAGADDYLTKPFHKDEFTARLRAIIRRGVALERNVVRIGELEIDFDMKRASVGGRPASLTGKEFQILAFLASRPGFTLSKEMILNHLYAGMDEPELKIVDVFICKLRKKLSELSGGASFISTVWGRGYMLATAETSMAMAS